METLFFLDSVAAVTGAHEFRAAPNLRGGGSFGGVVTFRRPPLPSLLRIAAAAAAAIAAWGPHAGSEASSRLRIVAIDVSASAGPGALRDARASGVLIGLGAQDRAAVVFFGADARVASPPGPPEDAAALLESADDRAPGAATTGADGTSLAAALRTAAALRGAAKDQDAAEVVVISDGRATDAPQTLVAAAQALRAAGGAVLRHVPRDPCPLPPVVRRLRGPGRVAAGEPFALEAQGVAPDSGGTIVLSRAGVVLERRAVRGPFRVAFARIEEAPGVARFAAAIEGGAPAAASDVLVAAPGSVLVITGRAAATFDAAARTIVTAPPGRADAAAYSSHDLVMVDGLPGDDLDPLVPALERFVRSGGTLLVNGGASAFAAGGWGGRAIEALSPLVCRPPGDGGAVVVLALDASGSMGRSWPDAGVRRDVAVGAAASAFVARAGTDLRVAVRRFQGAVLGGAAPTVHDGSAAGRAAAAAELLAAPEPAGSTAFAPVLADALAVFAGRAESRRHLVVFSDGETSEDPASLAVALGRLRDAKVAVTVVVPGEISPDASRAASLLVAARVSGAEVLSAIEPAALDTALRRVGDRIAGPDRFAGPADVVPAAGAEPLFRGTGARAEERNVAYLAEGATPLLVSPDGRIVAAQRTLGAGRVVAVATDAASPPMSSAGMLRDLAGLAARPASAALRAEQATGAGGAVLRVRAATQRTVVTCAFEGPSGEIARVPVRDSGRGVLVAEIPAGTRPTLARLLDGTGSEVTACGVDRPAPPEHLDPPVADFAALAAEARGGRPAAGVPLRPWFALLAVALLVAASAVAWARPSRRNVKSPGPAAR